MGKEKIIKSEPDCCYSKQKAISLHNQREGWHSSPTKGDNTINSINPISIPSSSPHWVNTHLHHTAKRFAPPYATGMRISEGFGLIGVHIVALFLLRLL